MVLVGGMLFVAVLGHEAGLGVGAVGVIDLLHGVYICIVSYVLHVHPGGFSLLQELSPVLCIGLVYGLLGFLKVFVVRPFLVGGGLALMFLIL